MRSFAYAWGTRPGQATAEDYRNGGREDVHIRTGAAPSRGEEKELRTAYHSTM